MSWINVSILLLFLGFNFVSSTATIASTGQATPTAVIEVSLTSSRASLQLPSLTAFSSGNSEIIAAPSSVIPTGTADGTLSIVPGITAEVSQTVAATSSIVPVVTAELSKTVAATSSIVPSVTEELSETVAATLSIVQSATGKLSKTEAATSSIVPSATAELSETVAATSSIVPSATMDLTATPSSVIPSATIEVSVIPSTTADNSATPSLVNPSQSVELSITPSSATPTPSLDVSAATSSVFPSASIVDPIFPSSSSLEASVSPTISSSFVSHASPTLSASLSASLSATPLLSTSIDAGFTSTPVSNLPSMSLAPSSSSSSSLAPSSSSVVVTPSSSPEPSPCDANPCQHSGTCHDLDSANFTCTCPSNWEGNTCEEDVDECQNETLNGCFPKTSCVNNNGSYDCVCPEGAELNKTNIRQCVDVNECSSSSSSSSLCSLRNQICRNLDVLRPPFEPYECGCARGSVLRLGTMPSRSSDCDPFEAVAPGVFSLKEEFVPELNDPESVQFRQMSVKAGSVIKDLLKENSFVGLSAAFSNGSVVVRFKAYFSAPFNATILNETIDANLAKLCSATPTDCVVAGAKIDPSSVKLNGDADACAEIDYCEAASTICRGVGGGSLRCICREGFEAFPQETPDRFRCRDIDDCAVNPKLCNESSNSICINGPGKASCECDFAGKYPDCEDFCGRCKNGASCEKESLKCSCAAGYEGGYCEAKKSSSTDWETTAIALGAIAGVLLFILILVVFFKFIRKSKEPGRSSSKIGSYAGTRTRGSEDSLGGVYVGDKKSGDHEYIEMDDPPPSRDSERARLTAFPGNGRARDSPIPRARYPTRTDGRDPRDAAYENPVAPQSHYVDPDEGESTYL